MVQAVVIALREGVEAALIIGITIAYLTKIGRTDLRRTVYGALAAAIVASVALAGILSRLNFNQDIFEGVVMLAAAFFVVTMVLYMARASKRLRADIEGRIDASTDRRSALTLFAFIFLMVLREGVETVLLLAAVSLNTPALMSFIGTILGLGAAVLFGVMFVKGTVSVDLPKFFRLTTVILILVAVQLLVSGLHELSENGVLPSSQREMALIGPIVRNEVFFFVTIVALAGLMALLEYRRRASAVVVAESSAARRKAEWTARRERIWMTSVYLSASAFIILVTTQFVYAKSATALSPATPVTATGGFVNVSAANVTAGQLQRFACEIDGVPVRFFVYRTPDGREVKALFDACDICGGKGYFIRSNEVICKNCDAPINPETVGKPGGCNPIPLSASIKGDAVSIQLSDLAAGKAVFQR
jgi:FTR1 family protein